MADFPRKLTQEPVRNETRAAFRAYPWTAALFESSRLVPIRTPYEGSSSSSNSRSTTSSDGNSFMRTTLRDHGTVRAAQSFYVPVPPKPVPTLTPYTATAERPDTFGELWTLYQLGSGAEGGGPKGIAHGGCIAALLDEQASALIRAYAPAGVEGMVYCNVRYHGSIRVPGAILCKAWKARVEGGRKFWVEVAIEDGEGRVVVRADVLFVNDERGGAKL